MQTHYNFNSGPAPLSNDVYHEAAQSLFNYNNSGLSILEISHRAPQITSMIEESAELTRSLLRLPSSKHVLFLHGGASTQFCMIPLNFLHKQNIGHYAVTGQWAANALHEASLLGNTRTLCSSADGNFSYLPILQNEYKLDENDYVHFTSNNTIYGTQWQSFPSFTCPLMIDMSSDIFSKPLPTNNFSLIYAGAQKNIGAAGVCMVIIDDVLLSRRNKNISTMLDYFTHVKHKSAFNTPPVFAIYTCYINLKWLAKQGGVEAMETVNKEKANALYNEIERNALFKCTVQHADHRSQMNVTFTAITAHAEEVFKKQCEKHNIVGINGYRTVGGFRVSLYNAITLEQVNYLIDIMKETERMF